MTALLAHSAAALLAQTADTQPTGLSGDGLFFMICGWMGILIVSGFCLWKQIRATLSPPAAAPKQD